MAGGYSWLSIEDCDADYFLGSPRGQFTSKPGKIDLLHCTCGVPGCWPLLARITVTEDKVIWDEFEQPHRSDNGPVHWDYSGFGPFVFDRMQYLKSLKKLYGVE